MARSGLMKDLVRPLALACVSAVFGSALVLLCEVLLDIAIPSHYTSGITFAFAAFSAFVLFPRVRKLPFGDVARSQYLHQLGFYLPRAAWKHVLLGLLLAACTISGMLVGSLLTGRYKLDWSVVTVSHTLFSINPGVWEELFYRGITMFLLLKATRSLKRAASIQIVVFGLAHFKGLDIWAWVDVVSVMVIAIAFTYAAYKTRTLVAGIVFHFLHDAFLFLPQVPGAEYVGFLEKLAFYGSLWLMVGVGCILVKLASTRLGVEADDELYTLD